MKFIHMADMHFDAPFTNLSDKENFGNIRRMEQRAVFKKIIDYIKDNDIKYLFISGDLYEHQHIRNTTINYINNLFKEIPNTKIFISPGNHDPYLNNSIYANFNWNNNVIIFNSNIKKYSYEDVDIYGYGFTDFYCENSIINNLKIENKNKINILVMHANLDQISDKKYNEVKTKDLDKLEFDYIALGHIHKPMKVGSETIRYCGTPMAYSVSEAGQKKGILMVDIGEKEAEVEVTNLPLTPMRNVRIIEGKFEELIKEHSEDFVTVELTDTEEIEALDMQERLKIAFPKLLEIRRNNVRRIDNELEIETEDTLKSPYELICKFIPSLKDDEKELIKNVINEVMLKEGE